MGASWAHYASNIRHLRSRRRPTTPPLDPTMASGYTFPMLFPRPTRLATLALLATAFACGPLPEDEAPPVMAGAVPPEPPGPPSAQQVSVDPVADAYADTDPSALTDFHAALDPHGSWVEDPQYGTVWVPNPGEVGPDFSPYETGGHWAYDDTDYVWYSDYDWGWAPFHYGRWMYGSVGWMWIPGRVYAPAWVTWRMGGPGYAYVGWAPMAADFYWRGGVAVQMAPVVVAPGGFYYAAHGDLFAPSLAGRVVARGQVADIAAHTQAYGGGAGGRPGMHGPAPSSMGIAPSSVVHANASDRQMQMAHNFAKPSTAAAMGGHPPTRHSVVSSPKARPSAAHSVRGGGGGGHGGHR